MKNEGPNNKNVKNDQSFGKISNEAELDHEFNQRVMQQRKKAPHPQDPMLIEERNSTEESIVQLPENNPKYNNILSIAKRKQKSKSKSYVPPNHGIQQRSQSSIEEESTKRGHKKHIRGYEPMQSQKV